MFGSAHERRVLIGSGLLGAIAAAGVLGNRFVRTMLGLDLD